MPNYADVIQTNLATTLDTVLDQAKGQSMTKAPLESMPRIKPAVATEKLPPAVVRQTAFGINAIAQAARSAGLFLVNAAQLECLEAEGADRTDLELLASVSGRCWPPTEHNVSDRLRVIAAAPEATTDWSQWIIDHSGVRLGVRYWTDPDPGIPAAADRVCRVIAAAVMRNMPGVEALVDTVYARQGKDLRATDLVILARDCHRLSEAVNPNQEDTTPYPYPCTPTAIVDALTRRLDENQFIIDVGELRDVKVMSNELPDLANAYVTSCGAAWYSKAAREGWKVLDGLRSSEPEDQSTWPQSAASVDCGLALTAGETRLALAAAPEAPFPTQHGFIMMVSPIVVSAWLNRITPNRAYAKYQGLPEPVEELSTCPVASQCPTTCGYVQRAGLLPFTLFRDGGHRQCEFREFREIHGVLPDHVRHQLAASQAKSLSDQRRQELAERTYGRAGASSAATDAIVDVKEPSSEISVERQMALF